MKIIELGFTQVTSHLKYVGGDLCVSDDATQSLTDSIKNAQHRGIIMGNIVYQ